MALQFDPGDEQLAAVETFVAIDSGLDLSEVFEGRDVSSAAKRQAGQEFVRAGLAHQSAGQLERAEKDFSSALLLLGSKADVLTLRASVRVQRAAALSGKPEFDEVSYSALKDIESVLRAAPDNEVAVLARSKWRILNFQFEDAEYDASSVLRREPANALAYGYRAMARIGRGCASLALTDLSEAIGIAPEDAALRLLRAKLYLGIGQPEKAKADFLQAALTDPIAVSDVLNSALEGFHVASSAHSCTQ
jgi:tetratricopeptide (TPR) repeat protein